MFWKELVLSEEKFSDVIEEKSSLCLAYQESMNNTICEPVVFPDMIQFASLTGNDIVTEDDYIGLNYEVCNVVFKGRVDKK
jgi:hypothetical protein